MASERTAIHTRPGLRAGVPYFGEPTPEDVESHPNLKLDSLTSRQDPNLILDIAALIAITGKTGLSVSIDSDVAREIANSTVPEEEVSAVRAILGLVEPEPVHMIEHRSSQKLQPEHGMLQVYVGGTNTTLEEAKTLGYVPAIFALRGSRLDVELTTEHMDHFVWATPTDIANTFLDFSGSAEQYKISQQYSNLCL